MLIACKECHKEISDSAEHCPQCGAPVRAKRHEIKAHQILSMVIAVAGLAIFMISPLPQWQVIGGALMIFGLIGALL